MTLPPWWKWPMCIAGLCGFVQNSDDVGIWGECATCGKRAGYVTRDSIRRYVEAEEASRRRLSQPNQLERR